MPLTFPVLINVPEVGNGYPIDGEWEIIVPIARTNEVLNPSFETNTTGYTAGAGSLVRSTTKQYHGVYSGAYTPSAAVNDGFFYGTISTTSGQFRAISCKFFGQANVPYALTFATTAGVDLVKYEFRATGRWQWIWIYYVETSTTTRRIYFRKNGSSDTHVFYVDGVQSEVINTGESVSTYIDGDQQGFLANQFPIPYGWYGTPHASSSFRTVLTRAGGYVIPFKKYSFLLTAVIGLGLATPQNVTTEYAQLDGGYPQYSRKPTSQFSVVGNVSGSTYPELRRNRSGLGQYFDRDAGLPDQTLLLRYRHTDSCGNVLSDTVALPCKYVTGWDGQADNHFAQGISITFETYLPNVTTENLGGTALNIQSSLNNVQGILQRSPSGTWSAMGTGGTSGGASTIVRGLDGKIYAGGDFTQMGGVANTNAIAVWDPVAGSWAAMGTGAAGGTVVYSLSVMPNGDIIAVGNFTSMGGVANTSRIAKWNGSAWSSISSAFVGTEIVTTAVSATGVLYVGGTFSSVGGVAATNVTSYNGSAWVAVGAGIAAGGVFDLLCSGTTIYAAVEASGVYKSTGGNFTSIGATTTEPNSLAMDAAGNLYAAGNFTLIGGISANNIAKYNGVTWSPLGTGLTGGVVARNALFFDAQGLLTVGGTFTTAGGIVVPGRSARWNGASWVFIDVIPDAASPTIRNGFMSPDGTFYLGLNNSAGTATVPGVTTGTNNGTTITYPTITIRGPSSGSSRIYSIYNGTTKKSIFLNLTVNAGETCKLVFQPDALSFVSDFQGNLQSTILPGSNEADFFMAKGANSFSFLSANSTVTAIEQWQLAYTSLDDIP